MHENGAHYRLERIDEGGRPIETFFDDDWTPAYTAHPPTKRWPEDAPYHLPKGARLRQTCTWNNTKTEHLRFPNEMCLMFSYYLDDRGFLICNGNTESAQ